MQLKTVIGIDPGPKEHAFVTFDGSVVNSGNLTTEELAELLRKSDCEVACEWIESFGMRVGKEVFQTVFSIGRLYEARPMRLIPRRDIKLFLCNSMRAKDADVRQALIDKLGPVGTAKERGPCYGISKHLWSALAVAVTAHHFEVTFAEANFCHA